MSNQKEWYTLREISEKFEVPLETVRTWYHKAKKLQGVRRGRYVYVSRSEVERIEKDGI